MNKNILIGLTLIGIGAILFFNRKEIKNSADFLRAEYLPSLSDKNSSLPVNNSLIPDDVKPINPNVRNENEQYTEWILPTAGEPYKEIFKNASAVYSLPINLLARVAYQESHFRPDIISGETKSKKGALGIMQIMPLWHPGVDPLNPYDSIQYAGKYLRQLYNKLGSWDLALAAYNWGIGNLQNKGFDNAPLETRNYVSDILSDIGSYRKIG